MSIFRRLRKSLNKKAGSVPICSAVIVAAGSSARMKGTDKLFALLGGIPVLARTLLAFERCEDIGEIVVVTSEKNIIEVGNICRDFNISKANKIICGGAKRMNSVLKGLMELPKNADLVAIHDGARPLVTQEIIRSAVLKAAKYSAAAPAVAVTDTVKTVESGVITSTPDRSILYAVQTPQVFEVSLIKAALCDAEKNEVELTDDCAAVERLGGAVHIVEGSAENIKLTVPSDMLKAEAILRAREVNSL